MDLELERHDGTTFIDCTKTISEYVEGEDWRIRANSNSTYSNASLVNNTAGKVIANYWLDKVYSPEEGAAHREGKYHIHDLDCLTAYCAGWNLRKLLDEGFNGVRSRINAKAPAHLQSALGQMANFLGILQSEWAGAQAFSSFDTFLAPYVFKDKLEFKAVKDLVTSFVYNLNVPSRWGQCVPENYRCLKADGTWVSYENLNIGDEIVVIDPKTGKPGIDVITHVNVFDAPEKMHKYYNKHGFNFSVTDRHRVIYKTGSNDYIIKESRELMGRDIVDIPIARWADMTPEEFMGKEFDIDDELLEFIAFIMCDGCIVKSKGRSTRIDFYKSNNRYGCDRFEYLCKVLDIPYSIAETQGDFNTVCNRYMLKKCETVDKVVNMLEGDKHRVPFFMQYLSPRQANIVVDTWVKLDGHFDGQTHWKTQCDNNDIQDMLAYLVFKTGKAVSVNSRIVGENKTPTLYANVYKRGCRTCHIEEVNTNCDKVWCPTTNTGTFVCMTDEGYVFITGNSPFTNVTIDWTVPNDLKDQMPTRNGDHLFEGIDDPELVEKAKERGCEALTDLCYKHFLPEMRMLQKAYFEVMTEGDTKGQPFTFPIPTVNITEEFDWDSENIDTLFENTAKRGSSYFQNFVGSQYKKDENGNLVPDEEAYKPDAVRSMCPLTLDTEVVTRTGEEIGHKTVKDLDPETDEVYGLGGNWYKFEKTEVFTGKKVIQFEVYSLWHKEKRIVKMSEDHLQPVTKWQDGGLSYENKPAKDIKEGDSLPGVMRTPVGTGIAEYKVLEKKYLDGTEPVQCISVKDSPDNLFILNCGLITHNCRLQLDLRELQRRGNGLFGSAESTGCYSDDTEVLTVDGWKLFKNVTLDDSLYTLNDRREIEIHKPDKLFEYDINDELLHFTNRGVDLLVTPNHNMVTVDTHNDKISLVRADECDKYFEIPSRSKYVAQDISHYIIKAADQVNENTKAYEDIRIDMDTWLKFIGLFISEGSVRGAKGVDVKKHFRYEIAISQKKEHNISIIDDVMQRMPFPVHRRESDDGTVQWVIGSKQLWEELTHQGASWEKHIPGYVFNCSSRQLRLLYDYLMLGDGNIRKSTGQSMYYTTSKRLADDMQRLLLLIGLAGVVRTDTRPRKTPCVIRGRQINKKHTCYEISVYRVKNRCVAYGYKKVPYKGKVYCVQVPNHTVYVRRNGKAVWCGNSIGVCTINMARLGYLHKGDKRALYKELDQLMDMAKSTLEKKREKVTEFFERGLYPYTKRYLPVGFKNHFSTIGVNGINEMIRNYTSDKHSIADEKGKAMALEVINHMREKMRKYQEETGHLYNLEASPSEGACYRFAREDLKRYPDIIQAGYEDHNYYTNSSQLPSSYSDDMFMVLEHQNDLQPLYTGGSVLHMYMGEEVSSPGACKELVKRIVTNYRIPYITITPTFSVCEKHGYITGKHEYCPYCDAEIISNYRKEQVENSKNDISQ